jgi:hypothetical protein
VAVTAASAPKVPIGRQAHDPPDDPEHHDRQSADDLDQGFGVLATHVERHAEHDGHQQCGEDALAGQRAEERLRDQRGDEAGQRQFLGGRLGHPAGVEGRRVDVHPGAGLEDVPTSRPISIDNSERTRK